MGHLYHSLRLREHHRRGKDQKEANDGKKDCKMSLSGYHTTISIISWKQLLSFALVWNMTGPVSSQSYTGMGEVGVIGHYPSLGNYWLLWMLEGEEVTVFVCSLVTSSGSNR